MRARILMQSDRATTRRSSFRVVAVPDGPVRAVLPARAGRVVAADEPRAAVEVVHHRRELRVLRGGQPALLPSVHYYGFFVESTAEGLDSIGLGAPLPLLTLVLPVGVSCFTFQAIPYVARRRGLSELLPAPGCRPDRARERIPAAAAHAARPHGCRRARARRSRIPALATSSRSGPRTSAARQAMRSRSPTTGAASSTARRAGASAACWANAARRSALDPHEINFRVTCKTGERRVIYAPTSRTRSA
jgi:hypothetical protein